VGYSALQELEIQARHVKNKGFDLEGLKELFIKMEIILILQNQKITLFC